MRFLLPLALIPLTLASCKKAAEARAEQGPAPVEVAAVDQKTMPLEMKAIGTVEPIASVQLKSKVQGEIVKVHFADGAHVNAGDVLFSIDPSTYEAALKRAQANLAMVQSTATNATEQANRYDTLIKRGVASKEEFSQYLSTAESQKSQLDARQADLDEAKLSVDWSTIRAPISGRAGAALQKAGNITQANGDTLAVINQMQPIYVTIPLPENSLAEVRRRMADGKPEIRAYEAESGELLGTGDLTFVDNTVDRTSGMILFKGTFPNEDERLWPGQFVDIVVKLAEEPNAVVIPTIAIMEGQQGSQVFVVDGDVASVRKIKVERAVDDLSIVSDGLKPGEKVITTGQLRVTSGGKVSIKAADNEKTKDPAKGVTAK